MKINTAMVEIIELIKPFIKNVPICIETGTHVGEGTWALSLYFEKVFTIEIVKELYDFNVATYDKTLHPRTTFLLGNSTDILKELVPTITENYCLFLDAHGSGGETGFDPSIGHLATPVIQELELCISNPPSLIIIDDFNEFGVLPGYPPFDDVRQMVAKLGKYEEFIATNIGANKSRLGIFHRIENK